MDRNHKFSKDFNVFNTEAETIIISEKTKETQPKPQTWHLECIDWNLESTIAQQICDVLFKSHINSVIIEGGAKTLQSFIDENLWDEARVFTGTNEFKEGIKAPEFNGQLISEEKIISDSLKIYTYD
jgi:diaminohydroxyphosphoribosylaminopyrimidine deaminase/5-amino-6-(5-phosphoribosylamino)uracil reductase